MEKSHLDGHLDRRTCRNIAPEFVGYMTEFVIGQTDQHLNAQFGISYNTWRKLRNGEPIRRSVADRLERRVAQLMCAAPSHARPILQAARRDQR